MSTIWARSSVESASNTTMSSSRLRNSGLKCSRTTAITASRLSSSVSRSPTSAVEPRLDVSTRITLRKSTVRPWPSVSRPSSSTCQQHVEDVGVGLLDLVEQHDRVRPAAHRLGQLAALLVADVAGRGTDQAGDRVLLGVLAHVDAHHRALVVEQERGQCLGQLGLADTGRAEEQERSGGTVRVADAGAGPAHGVRHRLHGSASDRSRARRVRPPCAAAWRSRPRAGGRPGCRSRRRRRRRCRRR